MISRVGTETVIDIEYDSDVMLTRLIKDRELWASMSLTHKQAKELIADLQQVISEEEPDDSR
uniref:Uncharacterized protein n=1 Tax=viral metagenome TaxID=1070528 RepID=A0A6M3LGI7_9ZZZZ